MQIVTEKNILHKKSVDLLPDEKHVLISITKKLHDYLDYHEGTGIGISAIQLGFRYKIAIIKTDELKLVLWNTKILSAIGETLSEECCLSLPGIVAKVIRYEEITIQNGDNKIYTLKNSEAIVAQHELDHWDGLLISDRTKGGIINA